MSATSTSNSRGEFKLEGLTPGKYAIFILPQQESTIHADAVTFEVLDQDVTELVVKSSPGASVAGTIVLENSEDKAAFARLLQLSILGFVQSETATGNISHSATINADGTFLLQGLEPGMAYISLGAPRDRALIKGFFRYAHRTRRCRSTSRSGDQERRPNYRREGGGQLRERDHPRRSQG